jgi:hypothetical protein
VITNRLILPNSIASNAWVRWCLIGVEVAAVFGLGRLAAWWWVAVLIVIGVELRAVRLDKTMRQATIKQLIERVPGIIMGVGMVVIITLVPRYATQVGAGVLYAVWLIFRERTQVDAGTKFFDLLIIQAVMFEAIFLAAAIWQLPGDKTLPAWLIVLLVWTGSYISVYSGLQQRGERLAGVMAATWGVVAAEIAWVLQLWLITYTLRGGYILVPQPALILTALAYVFGSVLASSRQGNLSRGRLAEYLIIALVLVMIVVVGTSWRGNA